MDTPAKNTWTEMLTRTLILNAKDRTKNMIFKPRPMTNCNAKFGNTDCNFLSRDSQEPQHSHLNVG